jgi:hypothetical protein
LRIEDEQESKPSLVPFIRVVAIGVLILVVFSYLWGFFVVRPALGQLFSKIFEQVK